MLSVGALIAFFQYAQRFYEPISDLSEKYNILQAAMAASERIFKLLDTPVRIKDDGRKTVEDFESIEFRNVWFAYNDEEWVLKNVSFRVNRGERIALVGHTGAGKTTVTALLLRFYEPQRGEILVNGINIREYTLESLRALFAIVQQDFFLFTGTVAQNISLADPEIPSEAVREAARRVQASRFIDRLPETYDAEVRERGAGFSVGEKQLRSLARALAFNPPVLVLDEATSSIDTETERLIQEAIRTLMEGRTSIVIAHRLSTIRSADKILVFHHGEIRERGTHDVVLQHKDGGLVGEHVQLARIDLGAQRLHAVAGGHDVVLRRLVGREESAQVARRHSDVAAELVEIARLILRERIERRVLIGRQVDG